MRRLISLGCKLRDDLRYSFLYVVRLQFSAPIVNDFTANTWNVVNTGLIDRYNFRGLNGICGNVIQGITHSKVVDAKLFNCHGL